MKSSINQRIVSLKKCIHLNNETINALYETIQVYRDVIKADEEAGKLQHVFEYAPLGRVTELITQMNLLKADNLQLCKKRKDLIKYVTQNI